MRRLSPEEKALWARVIASVEPLHEAPAASPPESPVEEPIATKPAPKTSPAPAPASRPPPRRQPGETLDGTWDRRLSRGLAQPDVTVDLHGHSQASAHALLDRRLEQAIGMGARVLLLITGKPPADQRGGRGAIRAAVGDWLSVSRHAASIAAVRQAHPRHGGAGALYIVLRRSNPNS